MFKESKQLREERQLLIEQSRAIVTDAEKEFSDKKRDNKELNDDENTRFDSFLDDIEKKNTEIERVERSAKLTNIEREKIEEEADRSGDDPDNLEETKKRTTEAFGNYLRLGMSSLDRQFPEQAKLLEERAQSLGTDSEGGFLVPDEFSGEIEKALKAFGGMRDVARIITTGTGQNLDWPTNDSTGNKGEFIAENAAVGEQDEVIGNVQLSSFIASSKKVKVSRVLMNDSFFDLDGFLSDALGERIGRVTNEAYTTGSGVSKPTGVIHGATIGITSASSTAITFDELKDIQFDLDPAYKSNASWMFNNSTLKAISKLKDSENRYLWQPSTQVGVPSLLLGDPFTINQDMDSIAAGKRSLLFGDFKKYIIRDVQGIILLRLSELFAEKLQMGFIAFLRTEGKLIDAGTGPIRVLRQPST